MNTHWKFVAGLFLFIVFAGSGLALDKKALGAPGAVQTQQGHTVSVPMGCNRTSGTCSCHGANDGEDLKNSKRCNGEISCQGTGTSGNNFSCSCKYKIPDPTQAPHKRTLGRRIQVIWLSVYEYAP